MARWTVQDGELVTVIEVSSGQVIVEIEGNRFTYSPDGVRDLRRKLGFAVGEADQPAGPQ